MTEAKKAHPLMLFAAVSVTLFSLLGIAAITGLLPTSLSKSNERVSQNETASLWASKGDRQGKAASTQALPAAKSESANRAAAAGREPARTAACASCGVVREVRVVRQEGEGSGLGAVAGGVVGGVLGNQVGGGSGKKIATVAGAAGGAYAGHQIEKNVKSTVRYDVIVNMDDGSVRRFVYDSQPAFQAGAKVRMINGALSAG